MAEKRWKKKNGFWSLFRRWTTHKGLEGVVILLSLALIPSGMLIVGHELGHVLTPTLDSAHDEEAKAYAFSLEWMRIIRENNIAGLASAIITEGPADNGLHNVAFFFVEKLIRMGKKAGEVYTGLIGRMIKVPASHVSTSD